MEYIRQDGSGEILVKVITRAMDKANDYIFKLGRCVFISSCSCRDYDWVVVYDDLPPRTDGSVVNEREELACPQSHTVLVTQEPPCIKLYPGSYVRQFEYVLTTHSPEVMPHPRHLYGEGSLHWQAGYSLEEAFSMPDYPKTRGISVVCSAKQMRYTDHHSRFQLVSYLAEHLPEMDWYGRGVREIKSKTEALSAYKYHVAVENCIAPYHWTDKISDPLLAHCLTFYAGDPRLGEILPPQSFIPIPLHNPEEALRIIREAMAGNEYEKRLPYIKEARRLMMERYNFYRQVERVILNHDDTAAVHRGASGELLGRHRLRRNPLHLVGEIGKSWGYRLCTLVRGERQRRGGEKIVKISDGLGNQMFQYAFARQLEKHCPGQVKLDTGWFPEFGGKLRHASTRAYALGAYSLSLPQVAPAHTDRLVYGAGLLRGLRRRLHLRRHLLKERELFLTDQSFTSLPQVCVLRGFFQKAAHADAVREELLRDFALREEPADDGNRDMLERIAAVGEGAVMVHVRRGDYLDERNRGSFVLCPPEYYAAAEACLRGRVSAPLHLFIFSDDPDWVEAHYATELPHTIVRVNDPENPVADMNLMRRCSHAIIAASTFSWWGAWLMENPRRVVVAPRVWQESPAFTPGLLPQDWVLV